jgi:hypothetical protein
MIYVTSRGNLKFNFRLHHSTTTLWMGAVFIAHSSKHQHDPTLLAEHLHVSIIYICLYLDFV